MPPAVDDTDGVRNQVSMETEHELGNGAEIAKLRITLEMLRRDLSKANTEANELRIRSRVEERRARLLQVQARRASKELDSAQASASAMVAELTRAEAHTAGLHDEGRRLEAELAAAVGRNANSEEELRLSLAEEAQTPVAMKMDLSDDEEDPGENDDLEFAYDGLDVSRQDEARFARWQKNKRRSALPEEPKKTDDAETTDQHDGFASDALVEDCSATANFEEHLKALQVAVHQMQGGAKCNAAPLPVEEAARVTVAMGPLGIQLLMPCASLRMACAKFLVAP